MKALVGSVVHCELVGCMLPEAESLRPKVHVADGEWLAEVCEKVVGVPAVGEGAAVVGHRPISTLLPFSGRPTLGRPMGSETHQQTDPPAADHPHAFISSLTTHSHSVATVLWSVVGPPSPKTGGAGRSRRRQA